LGAGTRDLAAEGAGGAPAGGAGPGAGLGFAGGGCATALAAGRASLTPAASEFGGGTDEPPTASSLET